MITHDDYPHEPGMLHGCNACEWMCHCDFPAIERGEKVECIFFGHPENRKNLRIMPREKLAELDEFLTELVYDAMLLDKALKKEKKRRKRKVKKHLLDSFTHGDE